MKKLIVILQISLLSFWITPILGQEQIPYGSNNGNYVTVYDTKIYYEEYGQGTPLLLLHGGGTPMIKFRKVIPELSNHFRVIAIDSPGWGRSEHPDSLSYQLMADYFSKLIDILSLDSVYIFGHSDGGNTAFLFAFDRPDKVKRIVVSGANSNTEGYTRRGFDLFESLDPQYLEANNKEWLEKYKSRLLEPDNWKKSLNDKRKMWLKKIVITDSKLEEIQSRTLIIHGDRDPTTRPEHAIHNYRKIKGSELCILPDTPHSTFIANPDLVIKIVIDFLTKE